MSYKRIAFLVLTVVSFSLLAGCRPAPKPTGAPQTAATPTPVPPTATLKPTPAPTRTPAPTATATPLPLEAWVDEAIDLEHVVPGATFVVHFNQPMDPASSASPINFFPSLPGVLGWNEEYTQLSFTPAGGFESGQDYLVTISGKLASAAGATFSPFPRWNIQIALPPKVVGRELKDIAATERRPVMGLSFSQAMDHDSVAGAVTAKPPVPLELRWEGEVLLVEPKELLEAGTWYWFTVGQTALNAYGVPLAEPYRWNYQAHEVVSSVRLGKGPDSRTAPIVVRFNYAMDPASVQKAFVTEPAVEGEWGWNAARTTMTFTPTTPLLSNAEYTLRFEGDMWDAAGNDCPVPMPFHFDTPPSILAVVPKANDSVHPATAVKITFDRPMDHAKTEAAFHITPTTPGSFEWSETTLVFKPQDDSLTPRSFYEVTVDTTACDPEGQPVLGKPYTWRFETRRLSDLVNFGWGPNAQVVDADGRRAIQLQAFEVDPSRVTFELYKLSLGQFLDRYASGFRGVAGYEDRPISTQDTPLAKSWQLEVSRQAKSYAETKETLIPPDVPPGLYVLNAVAGHLNDQLIVILTRHTIMLKQAEGQIVAWVTDIDGGSIADIEVRVYARNGELLGQGHTDEQGVYRTAVERDPQPLIVVAAKDDDVTASGLSNEWRTSGSQWWAWWQPAPAAVDYAAYIYTDRPIYRPGQTVFFKGVLRRDDDAVIGPLPAGISVTARIRDARNNVVQTFALAANELGTVNGEFQLAEGAMLGQYAVEMALGNDTHRQAFKVEDYRKPDYEITLATNAATYLEGETVTVSVDCSYFFGEPVANASVSAQFYELTSPYYWYDTEDESEFVWYKSYREKARRGRTDADGHFVLTFEAAMGNYARSIGWRSSVHKSTWGIEFSVDDGSHQTVSNFAVVHVYDAAEQLWLDMGGYFFTPGQAFNVQARATTVGDEPVSGRALELTLRRYNRQDRGYTTIVQSADLSTGPDGWARAPFTIQQPGSYQLYLSGEDRAGHPISYARRVYAFSEAALWERDSDGELSISADRESYAPGEFARLAIESSFSGPALLTFERGATRRHLQVELTAPLTLLDVPVQADDAPNIFVTVNAWRTLDTTLGDEYYTNLPDSQLHTAHVELSVPVTDKTLTVAIEPDCKGRSPCTFAPREKVAVTLRVTDGGGRPAQAELSLAMVDEAIFSLSDELAGPIFDAFYYERDHIVRTYDAMALRRYLGGNGMGGGGDGGAEASAPRSDFRDTAAWLPTLRTDANGEVTVNVTLPDNLSSWRLTAKAVTADTRLGEAFVNILTHQPIIVRPILPNILTAGDQVELSAVVHNYSDLEQELLVTLSETGETEFLKIEGDITHTLHLTAGEVVVVGWPARALKAGEAQIIVRVSPSPAGGGVRGGVVGDAVQLPLPIRPLAVPDVASQVGEFGGELTIFLDWPAAALEQSQVKLELSRSIAGTLLSGLEYLTGYPYGCVEQTMSAALPNAVVGRAFRQLGVGNPSLQADLPPKINASLQRLYGYQHNDGGWGWWYDDSTDVYQTAWVVFGLSVTKEAGYEVDPQVIQRGVDWLKDNLESADIRTRAYALYSLAVAGYGDLEATQELAAELGELDVFSQAGLALAFHELGQAAQARQIVDSLAESAVVQEGKVYWPSSEEEGHYYDKTMSSATRSTALALSAFVKIAPEHELEGGIVRWLMGQRRREGWG
ncbi:MAG: Ig-like domain-containing protein, partial [Thermoflexales bacterium]|nr:Ig-like domain-containing protein [Thermoflexales bacterium]